MFSQNLDEMEAKWEHEIEQKRKQLELMLKKPLVIGETWFMISSLWFRQLEKFLENGARDQKPGPIDNSPLFNIDSKEIKAHKIHKMLNFGAKNHKIPKLDFNLRAHLIVKMDFILVPEEAWTVLVQQFSLAPGQPAIPRKVIEVGIYSKELTVEIYLNEFRLVENSKPGRFVTQKFSKMDSIAYVDQTMRAIFGIDSSVETRLWTNYANNTYKELEKSISSISEAGLYSGDVILIEQQLPEGSWARIGQNANSVLRLTYCESQVGSSSNNNLDEDPQLPSPTTTPPPSPTSCDGESCPQAQPGICGLSNLGNTCFMNSIIQGLSNTPPIVEYFSNDKFFDDINEENSLGMKGELARSFGQLIRNLWSGEYSFVVPREFKEAVGRFAPRFSGFSQQDSQELLTFLLDGLHEDLNRIKEKPCFELESDENRSDEELAQEAWATYKTRNDSVILDLFQGLLKSTVVCPECSKVSVTFDPFCNLALPLPEKENRKIEVTLDLLDAEKSPKKLIVNVPKSGNMTHLCEAISKLIDVDISRNLIVTDVFMHRFHKIYKPEAGLHNILNLDHIVVHEIPEKDNNGNETLLLPVYLREKTSSATTLFGQPLLVQVPASGTTYEELYNILVEQLSRNLTPLQNQNEEWWRNDPTKNLNQIDVTTSDPSDNPTNNGVPTDAPISDLNDNPTNDGVPTDVTTSDPSDNSTNDSVPTDAPISDPNDNPTKDVVPTDDPINTVDPLAVNSTDPSSSSADGSEVDDAKLATEAAADGKGPPKLFSISLVNAHANLTLEELNNDGEPLQLSNKQFLSLDWHPKAKELFYKKRPIEGLDASQSSVEVLSVKKPIGNLDECIKLYTSLETLDESEAWLCPQCEKPQEASKKFDIWSLPSILVFSLKRFAYNRFWRDKIETFVDFPIRNLDMAPYIINPNHEPVVYDLIAVSNHSGSLGSGHYTCYAKNDGEWYFFNDSSVEPMSEADVVTDEAYVLFYQRRDPTQPSPNIDDDPTSPKMDCEGSDKVEEMDTD